MPEVDTRYGRMVVPGVENDIVSRFLTEYGEWADLEIQFVAGVVAAGAKVADIGAFIGTFGLGMQSYRNLASICFVEANPEIVPLLKKNVERNCRVGCAVVDALVAPANFRVEHGLRDAHNLGSASFLGGKPSPTRIQVSAPGQRLSLSQLEHEHGPFDFIKLDVEGMELPILADEPGILQRKSTTFWMECNEHEASLALAELFVSHGRNVYYFAYPSFNPENFRASRTPIFPFAYEAGLLACAAKPKLVSKLAAKGCILRSIANREDLRAVLWHTPRWAPREWWNIPTAELVALAGHELNGDAFERFLTPGQSAGERSEEGGSQSRLAKALTHATALVAERDAALREYSTALARAEGLVAERDAALREYKAALAKAEGLVAERNAALAGAQSRLAERRSYMIAQEEQLRQLRVAKETVEVVAAHQLALLRVERDMRIEAEARMLEIKTSMSWRATARLRALFTKRPRLRRLARRIVRGAARMFPGWR